MQDEATQIFLAEAQELQDSIERNLLNLGDAPDDAELIAALFRELHTLKGSSGMFGFIDLSQFIHKFETAFEVLRAPGASASPALISVALAACDRIEPLLTDPEGAKPGAEQVLEQLVAALNPDGAAPDADDDDGFDEEASDEGEGRPLYEEGEPLEPYGEPLYEDPAEEASSPAWLITLHVPAEAISLGVNPLQLLDELRELGGEEARVSVAFDEVKPLGEASPLDTPLTWSVGLPGQVTRAEIDDVFLFSAEDIQLEITQEEVETVEATPDAATTEDETVAPEPNETATAQPDTAKPPEPATGTPKPTPPSAASSMRVATERLDELMDRVGELVIAEARLHELSSGMNHGALLSVAEDIRRLTSGMRETAMNIRMVPVGTLFGRFRRLVHDLELQLGKSLELVTIGGDTELDKTVIELLGDPLVHMVRNAIDHGIEAPDTREARGKSKTGRIEISARQAGAEVAISISDDGAGLDLDRIRARAVDRGLIAPEGSISDADLRLMIFEPGFSTAEQVTELSGRGVGMDVVRTTIESLRGQIEVDSEPGHGTTVTLRLPLTLAIIDGLLVEVGDERYTVPLSAVQECVELPPDLAKAGAESNFLNVRDGLVPFLRLHDLFGVEGARDPWQKVVIVGSSLGRVGLVVDRIVTTNQTVIKHLSRVHAGIKTFSGSTILGDGTVSLIVDVATLIGEARQIEEQAHRNGRIAS